MLELERFLEEQAKNGRIISINTEITGLENLVSERTRERNNSNAATGGTTTADTTTLTTTTHTSTKTLTPPTGDTATVTTIDIETAVTLTDDRKESSDTTAATATTTTGSSVTSIGAASESTTIASTDDQQGTSRMESQSANMKAGGGIFHINITGIGKTEVYCDTRTDGGGWIVFQRRIDGSVDFNRNWAEYANGFGNVTGEFWLGLEKMHRLTRKRNCELRIDMIRHTSVYYYAKYSHFNISSESENYKLTVEGYSGNATDSFVNPKNTGGILNGRPFSTKDFDNDNWEGNCADEHKCGWWFNDCKRACLNSEYEALSNYGITWMNQDTRKWMRMKFTEMKLRCKEI